MLVFGIILLVLGTLLQAGTSSQLNDLEFLWSAEPGEISGLRSARDVSYIIIIGGIILLVFGIIKKVRENREGAAYGQKLLGYTNQPVGQPVMGQQTMVPMYGQPVRQKGANEWKCAFCGTINANYVGTCQCDKTREESNEVQTKKREEAIRYREMMIQNKGEEVKKEEPKVNLDENIESVKKLKGLLDAGIISQEEFDAKKKELLGL